MYFALIGHDDHLLELPKQVCALDMCWVGLQPIFPEFMENFDVAQMLLIGFKCLCELRTGRAASEGLGCGDGAFIWGCFHFRQ